MRTWRLARRDQSCGGCAVRIAVGETLLDIHHATATVVRCQACGEAMFGEPAPAELPAEDVEVGVDLDALQRQRSLFRGAP
jgi:hypothetical protein